MSDGQKQKFILSKMLDAKDEVDRLILSEINNPAIFQLNPLNVVFLGDKNKFEKFAGIVFDLSQLLLKANEHRRKYILYEKQEIEKAYAEANKTSGSTDMGFNPVELTTEIDGFLVQVKSSLDQLACTLDPLFGFKFEGWHKKNNPESGIQESGFGILLSLENNLPKSKKEKSHRLVELLKSNIGWLSYIVFLRDNPVHKGGAKNITQIIFERESKKVIPQMIIHGEGKIEEVGPFLTRTIYEVTEFINGFLLLSMELAGAGLVLIKTQDGYGWGIPNTEKKSK